MRKRIFAIIEASDEKSLFNKIYDFFMIAVIVANLAPLAFKTNWIVFEWIDRIAVVIFIVDYVLRLITADFKLNKGIASFFLYPVTPMAVLDLVCIFPSLHLIRSGFKILKLFRLFRFLRVLRVFKAIRHSKSIQLIKTVFIKQRRPLITVALIALTYVIISSLIVFNVEPESFGNFFDAVYWATVSLTTVGYGDIYPVTVFGRIVTMVSSVFGIAIVALPSGIITAGIMEVVNVERETESKVPADRRNDSVDADTACDTEERQGVET